jgi:hypothetical protein
MSKDANLSPDVASNGANAENALLVVAGDHDHDRFRNLTGEVSPGRCVVFCHRHDDDWHVRRLRGGAVRIVALPA